MDQVEGMTVQPLANAKFVKPYRLQYKQNGVEKTWEVVSTHPSVAIIIFNVEKKKLIFVKQFRPAVYFSSYPRNERELKPSNSGSSSLPLPPMAGNCGVTMELCAGIVDKQARLADIAREEVMEECGYEIKTETLEQVITFRSGVGASGDKQTMFYVEVTNDMKVGAGGGLAAEGELIEVEELSIAETRLFLQQKEVQAPSGLLFALMWFLTNKAHIYE